MPEKRLRGDQLGGWFPGQQGKVHFLGVPFHLGEASQFLSAVAARDPNAEFAYVVTPNVDHVVRINENPSQYRSIYESAILSINDSRVLRLLAKICGISLPVLSGSDLVAALFELLRAGDKITVIGSNIEVVDKVRKRAPQVQVFHHDPPMGFISRPNAVREAMDYVRNHDARFVFFCVGSPQQEVLASQIAVTNAARGLGLCVGSALHFLTGVERRAPLWLRGLSLEWAHRLLSDPRRLWRRYLLRGPRILLFLGQEIRRRRRPRAPD